MLSIKAGGQRMAEHSRPGSVERDVEQAITALKKGAQLLKYGRRGKPKFCPFRLSNDESALIWYSGSEEKRLWLNAVSRIVPGQRTAIFQRYPRPEKEYQSFSLIHSNDERSLDLICKDKDEAEVWFVGLKALVSRAQLQKPRFEFKIGGPALDVSSQYSLHTSNSSPLTSPFGSTESLHQDCGHAFKLSSPHGSPHQQGIEKALSADTLLSVEPKGSFLDVGNRGISMHSGSSDVGSDSVSLHMKPGVGGGNQSDAHRVSMSSGVSSSSQGSGQEEGDALGDVFMWGEGIGDGILGGGVHRVGSPESHGGHKLDALLPKALESAVVLDVQNIACGSRHAALVTKQGEVFTWGEESGGRLGHGVDCSVLHPQLVETLAATNMEFVACGEYHSCAVSLSGDLYTWGDGTHNFGLLGHGNDISHWTPKRLNSGPLEGTRVSAISCGPWHTALITSAGQLFTFGDGTFGVLGHGDKESVYTPREVESLKGLKTVGAACGVWHTAAVVEVMAGYSNTSGCSSRKLFTWGDGDKGRLGHGDKEQQLVPTCVAALVDHNFRQVSCGNSLTVALTTSGQVFTMGSPSCGQLGDPQASGKVPCLVEGNLWEAYVEEIACGAHHVAVLTHKTEVYTWGKGTNGQLGHGDTDDRNTPTLVEALRDKQVKNIACGASFTAAICLHKWPSGADQSVCSGCRQLFGFTRKRHNCYNCGLVFCHACSLRKAPRASLAPNPAKPYRVCDPCYMKLKKSAEAGVSSPGILSKKAGAPGRWAVGTKEGVVRLELPKAPQPLPPSQPSRLDPVKQIDEKSVPNNLKMLEWLPNLVSAAPNAIPLFASWGNVNAPNSFKPASLPSKLPIVSSHTVPSIRAVSRAVSPLSRRASPPRSTTPTPTISGLTTRNSIIEELKRKTEALSKENLMLRTQVESLVSQSQNQEKEIQHSAQQLQNAISVATEEAAKARAAKEVIKSLTAQLHEMVARIPGATLRQGLPESMNAPNVEAPNGNTPTPPHEAFLQAVSYKYDLDTTVPNVQVLHANGFSSPQSSSIPDSCVIRSPQGVSSPHASPPGISLPHVSNSHTSSSHVLRSQVSSPHQVSSLHQVSSPRVEQVRDYRGLPIRVGSVMSAANSALEGGSVGSETVQHEEDEGQSVQDSFPTENGREPETEWVEQDEPGVYITLVALRGGGKDLKRVRFSRKRFTEVEAEQWWAENRVRVYERYNVKITTNSTTSSDSSAVTDSSVLSSYMPVTY